MSARRFRLQFTLRQMLVAVTVLAIPLSLVGWRLRVHRRQQAALEAAQAQVAELGGWFWKGNRKGEYNVELNDRNVTDRQLEALARHLRRFPGPYLDQTHDVILDLRGNPISDEGLQHLIGVRLVRLDLRNTPITDRAVPTLQELDVPFLVLIDTRMTESGVQQLRQRNAERGMPYQAYQVLF